MLLLFVVVGCEVALFQHLVWYSCSCNKDFESLHHLPFFCISIQCILPFFFLFFSILIARNRHKYYFPVNNFLRDAFLFTSLSTLLWCQHTICAHNERTIKKLIISAVKVQRNEDYFCRINFVIQEMKRMRMMIVWRKKMKC